MLTYTKRCNQVNVQTVLLSPDRLAAAINSKRYSLKKTRRSRRSISAAQGCKDFIKYSAIDPVLAKRKRAAYIERHRVMENWRDPMRAGTLSRYILWEKPTLERSIKKFAMIFKIKEL